MKAITVMRLCFVKVREAFRPLSARVKLVGMLVFQLLCVAAARRAYRQG